MKEYILAYHENFDLVPSIDIIWDEYEYIVNGILVVANHIHHIFFGASKFEHISNWMALTYENHDKAHQEKLNRYDLKEIHLQFLSNNPYK